MNILKNMNKDRIVITFPNETQVLRFESILKKNKIKCKLIPIPREISSGCGIAIQTDADEKNKINELISINNISINGIHENI